jgi:hypothetical protein
MTVSNAPTCALEYKVSTAHTRSSGVSRRDDKTRDRQHKTTSNPGFDCLVKV